MTSRTSLPRKVQVLASLAASTLLLLLGMIAMPGTANADSHYCGSSKYVDQISVQPDANGRFTISVDPNDAARTAWDPHEATIEMWHAVQACVPGLYGNLADRIWDQLECHQYLALVPHVGIRVLGDKLRNVTAVAEIDGWATGETYDLESWRPPFDANHWTWVTSRCGNGLPDYIEPGATDLYYGDYA